jgi:hypothetical protein
MTSDLDAKEKTKEGRQRGEKKERTEKPKNEINVFRIRVHSSDSIAI